MASCVRPPRCACCSCRVWTAWRRTWRAAVRARRARQALLKPRPHAPALVPSPLARSIAHPEPWSEVFRSDVDQDLVRALLVPHPASSSAVLCAGPACRIRQWQATRAGVCTNVVYGDGTSGRDTRSPVHDAIERRHPAPDDQEPIRDERPGPGLPPPGAVAPARRLTRVWPRTRSAMAGRNSQAHGSCREATRRNRRATMESRSAALSTRAV